MKSFIFAIVGIVGAVSGAAAALPRPGFYQTIDDKTNTPKSIVALYTYDNGTLAGRIVALYNADGEISETIANPVKVAEKVDGKPHFAGLDIIWKMNADGDEYRGGKIMDPQSGSVYSSVIWNGDDGKLNVRGKIGPFGRTQHWNTIAADTLPAQLKNIDTSNWTPIIRD